MTNSIYGTDVREYTLLEPYQIVTRDIVCEVDVCVIGSGAAGAILAAKLAKSGKSVVLIERGGYYDGKSMNQREADMIPRLWMNAGFNFTSNLKIAIAQGSCLGGSTVINDAVCFRMPDIVKEQWQKLGVSISKEEWDKAYEEVEKKIHVTEVTDSELNQNARMLKMACEKFTIDGNPIKHEKNRRNCGQSLSDPTTKSCMQCGFCHLGCHYDTKQSMLVTYIHDALQNAPDYTAYCNCKAQRITYEDNKATGVDAVFVDSSDNETSRLRVNSKVVIVSAGSIASSNLLQRSMIGGENVGKGLALHPAPFVMGHFKDKIYGNRGIPMSYTCHEFGVTNGVEKGGFLIESIFLPVFQMAIAIPTFGINHLEMMRQLDYYTMAGLMIRDEPVGSISMTYSGNPKVDYSLSQDVINTMARGMDILARMWFGAGADHVITSHKDIPEIKSKADIPKLKDAVRNNPDGLLVGSAHPQGGNRMGDDNSINVVDSDCKVFGFNNLYVCDASVFPTALGVNPQLTIMALATITADKIIQKWNSFSASTKSFGSTCDKTQPRFCSAKSIGEMYMVLPHDSKLFSKLANSTEEKITVGKNWSFDPKKLQIRNNLYWRGFYGRDTDTLTTGLRFFGGFYKRFLKRDDDSFQGVTHPFETPVDAKSIATEKQVLGYGKVIHLEYQDLPYSQAYDLLKMIDEDTILGKAFIGQFGKGRELFNFSMSRTYGIDFMTKDDLLAIFNNTQLSHTPTGKELAGSWEGMLVSNSAISPRSQVFYFDYEDGEIDMRYSFANMLKGRSDVTITDKIFRANDGTPFHDEIRMVTPDIAVGIWVSDWSQSSWQPVIDDFTRILPISFKLDTEKLFEKLTSMFSGHEIHAASNPGISFLGIEEDEKKGTRVGLYYLLKRISH